MEVLSMELTLFIASARNNSQPQYRKDTTKLPVDLFLTTTYSRAYLYGQGVRGVNGFDVFQITINSDYVRPVPRIDPKDKRDFQTEDMTATTVPIIKIEHMGRDIGETL
jgi:hypothetical protein